MTNIDWLKKRAGYISASNLSNLMMKGTKGRKWGDTAISYMRKLEYERMMGCPGIGVSSAAMAFGIENEHYAVDWIRANVRHVRYYEEDFPEKPFITVPWARFGATPDADVPDADGLPAEIYEIKCTYSDTATYYYFSPTLPYEKKLGRAIEEHRAQIAGQFLACPSCEKIHIVKYNPQRDNDEWDLIDSADPRRGIVFTFTREEMGDYLDEVKARIIEADQFLDSGLDLDLINQQ